MAGAILNFMMKLSGDESGDLKLQRMKKEAQNTKPLFNKAIIILEMSEMKTFKMGGRPAWKPSQRVGAMAKGKTLQRTGRLRGSVTGASPDAVRKQTKDELVFGTNVVYGPAHQFGYKPRNIPERKFLAVYPEDIKKMEEVFSTDLENRLKVVASG